MLLYLIRHGKTDLCADGPLSSMLTQACRNDANIVHGHLNPPLSGEGKEQVHKLAEHLRGVPFREVWTSDLKRAEDVGHAPVDVQRMLTRIDST